MAIDDRRAYQAGITGIEDGLEEDRKDLSKKVGVYVSPTAARVDITQVLASEFKTRSPALNDHPLVKDKGFTAHERGSKEANEILARLGVTNDSFNYEDRPNGTLHRQVLTKTSKTPDGGTYTVTAVGAAAMGLPPDSVNVTVTDPKTNSSYSHSVTNVFIDKDRGEKTKDRHLKEGVDRLKKLVPEVLQDEPGKLRDLLKQGEGIRVETVSVTDKDGRTHTQTILKAVDNQGTPIEGAVLTATQVTDEKGRREKSSVRERTAEDIRERGAKILGADKSSRAPSPDVDPAEPGTPEPPQTPQPPARASQDEQPDRTQTPNPPPRTQAQQSDTPAPEQQAPEKPSMFRRFTSFCKRCVQSVATVCQNAYAAVSGRDTAVAQETPTPQQPANQPETTQETGRVVRQTVAATVDVTRDLEQLLGNANIRGSIVAAVTSIGDLLERETGSRTQEAMNSQEITGGGRGGGNGGHSRA